MLQPCGTSMAFGTTVKYKGKHEVININYSVEDNITRLKTNKGKKSNTQ
jgi:hypothetical protein